MFPDLAPVGLTTSILATLFFGSVNLFAISLLGEYIAKIFEETKRRPHFLRRCFIRNGEIQERKYEMKLFDCPCPICGAKDRFDVWLEVDFDEKRLSEYSFASRKFPEFMNFRMVRCRVCDLLYATPRPQTEWFNKSYEKAKYDSDEEATYAARTYARHLARILPNLKHKAAALDIGTGNGAFLMHLIKADFKSVRGVEPSLSPIRAAAKQIRPFIKVGLFYPDDFKSKSFSKSTVF